MRNKIVSILEDAGKIIANRIHTVKQVDSKSTRVDLVTEVDRQVELFLMEKLSKLLPNSEFLAEETASDIKEADKLWIMDPIDGTVNFVHGFPFVCISLALHENGEATRAYVYNPILNYLFEAHKEQGSRLNGKIISVSKSSTFEQCIFATGFPYDYPTNPDNNLKEFDHFHRRVQGIRRPGSAALDMAFTASGSFDGFWEQHLKPWDVAAGILLIREAGGVVSKFDGSPYKFGDKNIVGGNPIIHTKMLKEFELLNSSRIE